MNLSNAWSYDVRTASSHQATGIVQQPYDLMGPQRNMWPTVDRNCIEWHVPVNLFVHAHPHQMFQTPECCVILAALCDRSVNFHFLLCVSVYFPQETRV